MEAVTLAAGLMLALPAASQAYVVGGVAWPGPTISYSIGGVGNRTAIKRAAGVWNKAKVGIRLQAVPAPLAQVQVGFGYSGPCDGQASIGLTVWPRGWVNVDPRCSKPLTFLLAVHEFGHVLGLGHERTRCAVMNSTMNRSGTPRHCAAQPLTHWLSAPLSRDDIRGARTLYGAQAQPPWTRFRTAPRQRKARPPGERAPA